MLKKIIIGILAVVILAATVLAVIGLLNPYVSYETTVVIDKPRPVVWKYFTDPAKLGEWLEGFKKIETISGNPNEVGSKYRIEFTEDGRDIVLTETVTAYRPDEQFAFLLEHEMFKSEVDVTATDSGGKTTLVQKEKVTGSNFITRILFVFMKSSSEERVRKTLDKLKANIESL